MNFKRIKISGSVVAVVLLYLYFSSPSKVVVDEHGEVSGLINSARELVQGKAFWKGQVLEVNSELEWNLGEPRRQAKINREMSQMMRETDHSMEEFYEKYPDMKPSEAERKAEALRERADQIKQQEIDRYLEKIRIERISKLRKILPIVKAKAELNGT